MLRLTKNRCEGGQGSSWVLLPRDDAYPRPMLRFYPLQNSRVVLGVFSFVDDSAETAPGDSQRRRTERQESENHFCWIFPDTCLHRLHLIDHHTTAPLHPPVIHYSFDRSYLLISSLVFASG